MVEVESCGVDDELEPLPLLVLTPVLAALGRSLGSLVTSRVRFAHSSQATDAGKVTHNNVAVEK